MTKKLLSFHTLLLLLFIFNSSVFAQGAKKPAAAPAGKGTAKGTLAADMDCSVKINGSTVVIAVKAYTPKEVTLKVGENKIEAVSSDKKSKYSRSVTVKAGENAIIEISFFEDGKFLDYVKTGNVNMVEAAIKKDPTLINNENGLLTSLPIQNAIENTQPK